MFNFFKKKKVDLNYDIYEVHVTTKVGNQEKFSFDTKIWIPEGRFPRRRLVTVIYKDILKEEIERNKFYGAKVYVKINCKIGTFDREYIDEISKKGDL